MKLSIERLTPEGVELEGEDPIEAFEWEDAPGDVVHPAGPMRWKIKAQLFGTELLVRGWAEAHFEGICCRCGGPLSRDYGDEIEISLVVDPNSSEVDLTFDLRETILLALPTNPLCSDDCPGVCQKCGKRLSQGRCSCASTSLEEGDPWAALDNI